MTFLDPIGRRSWAFSGPPWPRGSVFSHAWVATPRFSTYSPSFPVLASVGAIRDQIGTNDLSASSCQTASLIGGRQLWYAQMLASGFLQSDLIASEISGVAKPFTLIIAGQLPVAPNLGASWDLFTFGNAANNNRFATLVGTNNSLVVTFQRKNDAGTLANLPSWTITTAPAVWLFQYNGVSSFALENGVQVAAGDLGGGASTLTTFAIGAFRGTGTVQFSNPNIVGAAFAPLAAAPADYLREQGWFRRIMGLI